MSDVALSPPKMKLWRWEHGRQNGSYSKFLLAYSKLLRFDLYLIRLPTTSIVPHHRDPAVEGFEHHRVNITLRCAESGGITFIQRVINPDLPAVFKRPRPMYRFRPDLQEHYMTAIMKGEVWLLSFGWLRKSNV